MDEMLAAKALRKRKTPEGTIPAGSQFNPEVVEKAIENRDPEVKPAPKTQGPRTGQETKTHVEDKNMRQLIDLLRRRDTLTEAQARAKATRTLGEQGLKPR